jgi:outer membrane protein TolC
MNNTAYLKFVMTFVSLTSWFIASSQDYPDSLLKYLEIAAGNNPSVQQKFIEYQAAMQKVPQAGSLSDPEFSLGVLLSPMELVNGNQLADIRLMQMFPWFGVLKSAKDEMSLMANAKFELFRDSKLQLFYDVQQTWYELFKVQKKISISEKNIEILKIIERLALTRFKSASPENSGTTSSGSSGLADLYTIGMETGELENNIAFLKSQRNTIIARFNTYLNRKVTSNIWTPVTIAPDSLGLSLTATSDSILAHNPMLAMLDYEKQSVEARKKMISRMSYPMVGLGLDYSVISKSAMSTSSMNGKDMIMPMLTVTLPVYRKKYAALQTEADLLKRAVSQNYQAEANSLEADYYQAVQMYEDAKRRVKLYKNQSNLASKSLDLLLKGYSVSASGLTDVLRIRQQTLDYELRQVEAVADFNTAIAWLKRLMAFSQVQ